MVPLNFIYKKLLMDGSVNAYLRAHEEICLKWHLQVTYKATTPFERQISAMVISTAVGNQAKNVNCEI